jgi:signal transduction histidine kinase
MYNVYTYTSFCPKFKGFPIGDRIYGGYNHLAPQILYIGKGIGLEFAVSKKLAEAYGGRINVRSDPGKGSTFTLVLRSLDINKWE